MNSAKIILGKTLLVQPVRVTVDYTGYIVESYHVNYSLQEPNIKSRCVHMHMSHFAYACKMRCPLNLVLENSEYLWFYWTFCIVISDCGLKLHKLSNHTFVRNDSEMIRNTLNHCLKFALHSIFCHICYGKISEKMSTLSLKLNYSSPRHQTAVFKVLISFKCS